MHVQHDVPPSEACGGSEAHRPRFMRAIPCFVSHHVEPLQLALAQVFLDGWSSRGESDRTLLDATSQNSTAGRVYRTVFWEEECMDRRGRGRAASVLRVLWSCSEHECGITLQRHRQACACTSATMAAAAVLERPDVQEMDEEEDLPFVCVDGMRMGRRKGACGETN